MKKEKMLVLGYQFYGYEDEILSELSRYYEIVYVDIRNFNFIEKNILRVLGFLNAKFYTKVKNKITNQKILKKLSKEKNLDILFVLGAYEITAETFKHIDSNYKGIKKVLYIWDTLNIIKNSEEYMKNFNFIASFDKKDSEKYNLVYIPTFYSKKLEKKKIENLEYEMIFIGYYTSIRYNLLNKVLEHCNKSYIYFYLPFKLYLLNITKKNIHFYKLKKNLYNELIYKSRIMIDLLQFPQTGVTQRVLEALYLEKKLITNNPYVKKYNFYNENNILVIDQNTSSKEILEFKNKEYIKISPKIIEEYSIETWVFKLFGRKK